MLANHESIRMIELAEEGFSRTGVDHVYTGGATVPLYLDDPAASMPRPTRDVDLIVRTKGKSGFYSLEQKLRESGFKNDISIGAPICRWLFKDQKVDIMPVDETTLGFTNPWYASGWEASITIELPSRRTIKILSLPYYLASKMAAFLDRGKDDYMLSADLADIIAVLDGQLELDSILSAPADVLGYLRLHLRKLSRKERFIESVYAQFTHDAVGSGRAKRIMDWIEGFVRG